MSDSYEDSYMTGKGEVLYRDKTVWRAGVPIVGIPALGAIGATVALAAGLDPSAGPLWALVPLAPALILTACTFLFTVLRVVVSTREVHIQYGVFGPHIPVEAITKCTVVDYDWTQFGGWGIRLGGDGTWAYSVMRRGARAVRIEWTAGGTKRAVVVTSDDPERLAAAIEQARAQAVEQAPSASVRARVEVAASGDDDAAHQELAERSPQKKNRK